MTIKQRIIEYLREHPEGVDDDALASALGLRYRQQANQRCRELEKEGLIVRRRVGGKIHNFWVGGVGMEGVAGAGGEKGEDVREGVGGEGERPWYWEGNVQAAIVRYLVSQGYLIRSVADTARRETGKDIVAEREGRVLWVTVKGYPEGKKAHPSAQAGHWFKGAVFDILQYRGEAEGVELGLGLPDFPRYRTLAGRIEWLKPVARFTYYWVREDGEVVVE